MGEFFIAKIRVDQFAYVSIKNAYREVKRAQLRGLDVLNITVLYGASAVTCGLTIYVACVTILASWMRVS